MRIKRLKQKKGKIKYIKYYIRVDVVVVVVVAVVVVVVVAAYLLFLNFTMPIMAEAEVRSFDKAASLRMASRLQERSPSFAGRYYRYYYRYLI